MKNSFKTKNIKLTLFFVLTLIFILSPFYCLGAEDVHLAEPVVVTTDVKEENGLLNNSSSKNLSTVGSILLNSNDQMTRTKEEIREKFLAAKTTVINSTYFDEEPVIVGPDYKEGTLSDLAISDTLKQLNFYRYLAGVNDVAIREENMSMNGKGAVLLSVSDFSHYPAQPEDMSDEFYDIAVQGTSYPTDWYKPSEGIYGVSGNVSSGIELTDSIGEYIDDTTNLVAASVGHRLSLLVPCANSVSLGYSNKRLVSGNVYSGRYTTITMFHGAKQTTDKFYTWPPAGNCPIEVTEPNEYWSVTLDSGYTVTYTADGSTNYVDNTKEKITITYNGKDYVIDSDIYYNKSYNTIYFALPTELESALNYYDGSIYDYYSYKPGEKVSVNISGSEITKNSEEVEIDYYVEFFQATPINVESISLNYTSLRIEEGSTGEYMLVANVLPENATYKDNKTWKSSNVSVAQVDSLGNISAVGKGNATITVECDGKKATCEIIVYKAPEYITLDETYKTINKGGKYTIVPNVGPDDVDDKSVTYSSSNENIVKVDSSGVVTAVNKGEAVITVKTVNGLTANVVINVLNPITDIETNIQEINLSVGETYTLIANALPEDTTDDKTLSMEILDENIAKIDTDTGIITALAFGETSVCIRTVNSITKYVKINVKTPSVVYQIQVEDEGWHTVKRDNEIAMRNISGHKMEAMKIYLENTTGGIEYNLHLENRGWQGYKADGTLAGIENGGLRAEGIKIRLTGNISKYYDIYYRVHAQNIGWLSWAKNDEAAGSSGAAFRIEGLQIVLVKKGAEEPVMDPAPDRNEPFYEKINVIYQTHIQNIGWQANVRNGVTSGAPGRHLRIEGIKIKKESTTEGSIRYKTHVQNKGWGTWVENGAFSGTEGLGLRTEAVMIELTGDLAEKFDVYYRIYVEDVGWLGWAKNGEEAGSTGYGKKLEGIEIRVLKKGDATAPETGNSCMNK